MMDYFDISELPERITQYRNQALSEALTRNAPYLQQMMAGMSQEQSSTMWQRVAQAAVNAMGNYMEPRVDSLAEGDDPRIVFYEHDQSEPVRSYVTAWIEGYATRALDGRCSEGEVRPAVEQAGISLYPIDNRIAYAETVLPQRGYGRECVSVAIGHAILSYAILLSGEMQEEDAKRFNWMGDIDGFAAGWKQAQRHDLGQDGYVPYSDEDQIDDFMRGLTGGTTGESSLGMASAEEPYAGGYQEVPAVDEDDFEDVDDGAIPHGDNVPSDIQEVETSLPDRYAAVFEQTGSMSPEVLGTPGIYIEVDDGRQSGGHEPDGSTGIVTTSDSSVFTTDDFEDVSEEEVLRIKTMTDDSPESITGSFVAVVSDGNADEEPVGTLTERTVRRLPPTFEKYLILTISSALRGNATRLAELTDAGMTFEQSERLKRKVMSATARYGLKELALMGVDDGVPADEDGTEPVRTYANSWLQGYISVITDGDCSQAAIIKSALMSVVSADDIADDVEHVLERQEWEGYDDECSMVTVAHLRVSLSKHGKGHPLAHAMEGTGRFNRRGATDGFSDGWWKATEIVRRIEKSTDPSQIGQYDDDISKEDEELQSASDSDMEKAKEEAKMLLAGLFTEDDLLPEESVNNLIGPPMPVVIPIRNSETTQEGESSVTQDSDEIGSEGETQDECQSERQIEEPIALPRARSKSERTPEPTSPRHDGPQDSHSGQTKPPQKRADTQERIRKHADACTIQAVKQKADAIKRMWSNTNSNRDMAKAWTEAVKQATASYGWHIVNDLNANPAKSRDDTRPMLTYAIAWISGYVAGFYGDEPTERMIQGMSQQTGISLGETGQQVSYARNLCSSKGYGAECLASLLRHAKHMFLLHHERNPESARMPDAVTYNWIADIDGYADGWFIGRRVMMQQQV